MVWWRNLALLVVVEVGYLVSIALLLWMPVGIAVTLFVVGFLGTAPTAALYLVLVAALPHWWSQRRRRAIAVMLSPLIGGLVLALFPIGLVVLPGTTLYGALVRLPPTRARGYPLGYATRTR